MYKEGNLTVVYPTSNLTSRFIKTIEAKGYVFDKEIGNYVVPANSQYYWIGTRIEYRGDLDIEINSYGG